ncbi:hypothetical protein KM043_016889 [Ampulex compressa]|nr:hypothetical protein KM043_016889 [Ampulex compressa]
MTKKCDDPKCPVNKKHRGKRKVDKKGETESGIRPSPQEVSSKDSYVSCPVHKKTTICKKSKKSTKAYRDRSSNFRNKKCQASKSTVECSTSTCPPRRIWQEDQCKQNVFVRGLTIIRNGIEKHIIPALSSIQKLFRSTDRKAMSTYVYEYM